MQLRLSFLESLPKDFHVRITSKISPGLTPRSDHWNRIFNQPSNSEEFSTTSGSDMTRSLIVASFLFAPLALGQPIVSISGAPDPGHRTPQIIKSVMDGDSSTVRITTKVPFQGKDYFIVIVPMDSSIADRMPVYNPYHAPQRPSSWQDSLRLVPADSILKLLPTREDFLRPRRPVRDR